MVDSSDRFPANVPNDYRLTLTFALRPVPLPALDQTMRNVLSKGLNILTVKTTVKGIAQNFRGLAELIGFRFDEIQKLSQLENPTEHILNVWATRPASSVGRLIEYLNRMERYDVIDDLHPLIIKNDSRHFMSFITSKEVETEEIIEEMNSARSFGLNYFPRAQWGAFCPREKISLTVSPVKLVFIHHSVWYDEDPVELLQITQARKVIHYGHFDVPYNFMISRDGRIFEGRGWNLVGSHTFGYNYVALSFAMLGNYHEYELPVAMIDATLKLLEYGIEIKKIRPDYGLYAHCDAFNTLSPGKYTLEVISKWPRYHALGPLKPYQSYYPEAASD